MFLSGLVLFYLLAYSVIDVLLNKNYRQNNAVFIWGDSQAYQGLDLNILTRTLESDVFTAAHHGAGVYDFLVFTDRVPEKSKVIVSTSNLAQIRRKENDYNRSGLSLWALKMMLQGGYDVSEVYTIGKNNLKPTKVIWQSTTLYPFTDSLVKGLPIEHFEGYYNKVPSFLNIKQDLFIAGVENLIRKECAITFVEFPIYSSLLKVQTDSPINENLQQYKLRLIAQFDTFGLDTIRMSHDKNIFRDLSHLNTLGATELSTSLGRQMLQQTGTTYYLVQ